VPLEVVRQLIRGTAEVEGRDGGLSPVRLPAWTREQQSDRWIEFWSAQTVGVSLVALTSASRFELDLSVTRVLPVGSVAPPFSASVVAEVDGMAVSRASIDEGPLIVSHADRTWTEVAGPDVTVVLELGATVRDREVTVWLPHNAHAVIRAIRADAVVRPAPASLRPTWLHHGSSISHGLEAADPLGPWPQQVARSLGMELSNLAIAGNAQLDPFVARTLAAREASVVSLELGVNIINADSMRNRTFVPALHGFLDLVREGHPDTPILVISPFACPAIEETPGPTHKDADGKWRGTPRVVAPGDGTLTLRVVRELIARIVEARRVADPLLWVVDGRTLFGTIDSRLLWDGLHPNQEGYDLIARRFVEHADGGTSISAAFDRAKHSVNQPR